MGLLPSQITLATKYYVDTTVSIMLRQVFLQCVGFCWILSLKILSAHTWAFPCIDLRHNKQFCTLGSRDSWADWASVAAVTGNTVPLTSGHLGLESLSPAPIYTTALGSFEIRLSKYNRMLHGRYDSYLVNGDETWRKKTWRLFVCSFFSSLLSIIKNSTKHLVYSCSHRESYIMNTNGPLTLVNYNHISFDA